jgi:hypothetical protein
LNNVEVKIEGRGHQFPKVPKSLPAYTAATLLWDNRK